MAGSVSSAQPGVDRGGGGTLLRRVPMGLRTHLIPEAKTNGVRDLLTPDSLSGFWRELSWDRRGRGLPRSSDFWLPVFGTTYFKLSAQAIYMYIYYLKSYNCVTSVLKALSGID